MSAGQKMDGDIPTEADYIVVGGGLTGCALASRLKEYDPSSSVLILEAGRLPTDKDDTVTPFGGFALAGTELDWQYQTQPCPTLEGRTFTLTAGKTLGGGSVLNYGGWSRGQRHDYDDWARKVQDERWSYAGLLPYMKRSEKLIPAVNSEQHGFEGPFKISSTISGGTKFPLCNVIEAAWAEIGVSRIDQPCSGELDGLSEFYQNWHDGKRQPAQLAYDLRDVQVLNETSVNKIVLSNANFADGVEIANGRTVKARKEVIVSAGTFQTPMILLRSGIKDSNIGRNYVEHFCVYQLWKLKDPERGLALGSPNLTDPSFFKWLPADWVTNEAPSQEEMERALDADGVHGDERESLLQPGRTFVETMIVYTAMAPGVPVNGSFITTAIMLTRPTSRGHVILPSSEDSTERPLIQPDYISTEFDRVCISHGVKRLAQLMLSTKTMQPIIECEVPPPGLAQITSSSSGQEILGRVLKTGMPQFHAAGTCALGEVVGADLKVKGFDRLRVCDASIFPTHIGGHPMATLYAVAEQAAEIVVQKR